MSKCSALHERSVRLAPHDFASQPHAAPQAPCPTDYSPWQSWRKADACADSQVKELLLRKADQSERTAAVAEWIMSEGLPPPE